MMRTISDGFGTIWFKCDREDCGLQVVRPGKAQCAHGEPCPTAEEWMRKNFPDNETPAATDAFEDGKDRHGNLTGWRAAVAKACGNRDPVNPQGVDDAVAAHVRHHVDGWHTESEKGTSRADVIEEVAKHVEASPLTYFGPDPGGIKDLRYLIVAAIRDMKGKP